MTKMKRKPRYEMPAMILDTPENVARALMSAPPPPDGWEYLKEKNSDAKRGDKDK